MDFPPFSNVSTVFQYFTRQILLFKYFRDNKERMFQSFKKYYNFDVFCKTKNKEYLAGEQFKNRPFF